MNTVQYFCPVQFIMTITERKEREKQELKDLILSGARKLFLEKGIQQTTMRNIAEAINYSPGTIYVYFKDKNDILHAIHQEGFKQLGGQFATLFSVADPLERLKAMGRVYIRFALDNPEMYSLMFIQEAPIDFLDETCDEEWTEGKATFNVLQSTVGECVASGRFAGHNVEHLSYLVWSIVHGLCSLKVCNRIKTGILSNPDTIVDDAYTSFLKIIDKL